MIYEDFFPLRLSILREQRHVTAREMSLALGQNESYINRIENKKTFPSMQNFFYICEYLKISPADFFNETLENPSLQREINNCLEGLTSNQLKLIENIAKEFKKSK